MYIFLLLTLAMPLYGTINQEFISSIRSQEYVDLNKNLSNLKYQNADGENFLSLAAYYGHKNLVEQLLDKGLETDFRETNGTTPLMNASYKGHIDIVETLLQQDADINAINIYKQTSLIQAVYHGQYQVIQLLLSNNANLNVQDLNGDTVLHHAIKYQVDPRFIELILSYEPDISLTNNSGLTPLAVALKYNNIPVIERFLQREDFDFSSLKKYTNLNYLVYNSVVSNNIKQVDSLLSIGGSPDACSQDNIPVLQGAASIGSVELMELLLNKGACIDLPTSYGGTALTMGVYSGEEEAVKFLLKQGANINHIEKSGDTALHIAMRRNLPKIVEILLNHSNIVLDVKNADMESPLDIAIDTNNPELMASLKKSLNTKKTGNQ